MNNSKAKSFKFCVGAVFLIIPLLWTLIEAFSLFDGSGGSYYYDAEAAFNGLSMILCIGATVTLCVFIFIKKNGLALAISAFAAAFATFLNFISTILYWNARVDYSYYDWYGVDEEMLLYAALLAFSLFMLMLVFVAVGISALLDKHKAVVKAMKITSLILAIFYVVFNSIALIFNAASGMMFSVLFILYFTFYSLHYVGILLTRGWLFKFIEACAEDCESVCTEAECANLNTAIPVYTAPVAEPAPAYTAPVAEHAPAYTAPVAEPAPAYTAPVVEPAPAAPASAPAPNLNAEEIAVQLRTYKLLLDDGIITQEEFDAKKKEILK